jgi:hypothetical protein
METKGKRRGLASDMSQKARLAQQILYASKAAKLAKASRLGIAASAILSFMIFAISYYGEMVGNFTLSVDREALNAGITLVETPGGEGSSRLLAPKVDNADGMTSLCGTEYTVYRIGDDVCIPNDETLTSKDGNNSGPSYLVYTFYVINAGNADLDLSATVDVISASKGAEEAIRLRVIIDGADEDHFAATYARAQTSRGVNPGAAEPLTEMFYAPTQVLYKDFVNEATNGYFHPGDTMKVTVVLWFEGEDADHNLNIVGGGVKLSMVFSVGKIYDQY